MQNNEFADLLVDALNDAELKSSDIPAIDLYVDQIINLHTEKLKEGSERFYDRQLTKTMINISQLNIGTDIFIIIEIHNQHVADLFQI